MAGGGGAIYLSLRGHKQQKELHCYSSPPLLLPLQSKTAEETRRFSTFLHRRAGVSHRLPAAPILCRVCAFFFTCLSLVGYSRSFLAHLREIRSFVRKSARATTNRRPRHHRLLYILTQPRLSLSLLLSFPFSTWRKHKNLLSNNGGKKTRFGTNNKNKNNTVRRGRHGQEQYSVLAHA